jgi:hypothetical protein
MFNFSANHLFLISRTEYTSCAVLVMLDRDTRCVFRLFDFTKRLRLTPGRAYCGAGKVNRVNTLWSSNRSNWTPSTIDFPQLPFPTDGAGG